MVLYIDSGHFHSPGNSGMTQGLTAILRMSRGHLFQIWIVLHYVVCKKIKIIKLSVENFVKYGVNVKFIVV